MRATKIISLSLPPRLLKNAERLAPKEGRIKSELFREALRRYIWQKKWTEIRAYGAQKARELGLREEGINRLIHKYREETRTSDVQMM